MRQSIRYARIFISQTDDFEVGKHVQMININNLSDDGLFFTAEEIGLRRNEIYIIARVDNNMIQIFCENDTNVVYRQWWYYKNRFELVTYGGNQHE